MPEINWQERCELVECLAKRICRDLRHALDEVPRENTMREMMVERLQGFKRDLGDTSEYVHALHYELRRADSRISSLERALAEARRPEALIPEPKMRPDLLPALPGQKELTFIMLPNRSADDADAAIAAMKRGDTIFLPEPVSEMFFLQLRLRVALEPALADRIAVYYLTPEREWQAVGLRFEDELRWPVGFLHEAWEKETETIAARSGDSAVNTAKEMKAELQRRYQATLSPQRIPTKEKP